MEAIDGSHLSAKGRKEEEHIPELHLLLESLRSSYSSIIDCTKMRITEGSPLLFSSLTSTKRTGERTTKLAVIRRRNQRDVVNADRRFFLLSRVGLVETNGSMHDSSDESSCPLRGCVARLAPREGKKTGKKRRSRSGRRSLHARIPHAHECSLDCTQGVYLQHIWQLVFSFSLISVNSNTDRMREE